MPSGASRTSAAISSKRGPKHGDDLRHVVDAMLYISHTGCQWRFLPVEFGPWTRVWSQFRRWSKNGRGASSTALPPRRARRTASSLHGPPARPKGTPDPHGRFEARTSRHASLRGFDGGVTFHTGRPLPVGQRANGSSARRHGLPLWRASRPRGDLRGQSVEQILDDSPARRGRTTELVLVDGDCAVADPSTLEQIQLRSSPSGWERPHAMSTGQVFVPSVTLGASGGPAISCVATSGALLRKHRDFGPPGGCNVAQSLRSSGDLTESDLRRHSSSLGVSSSFNLKTLNVAPLSDVQSPT